MGNTTARLEARLARLEQAMPVSGGVHGRFVVTRGGRGLDLAEWKAFLATAGANQRGDFHIRADDDPNPTASPSLVEFVAITASWAEVLADVAVRGKHLVSMSDDELDLSIAAVRQSLAGAEINQEKSA